MPTLYVFLRSSYGVNRLYLATDAPDRAEFARALRKLTGRDTLTESDVEALKELGYSFAMLPDPKNAKAFNL